MSDYITLIGAEDVRSAGYTIRTAAGDMLRAARNGDETVRQLTVFMDDWLQRFSAEIDRLAAVEAEKQRDQQ